MEILREKQTRSLWEKVFIFVGLVIAATLINIGGSQLCAIFGLPLYLDSIGTMLAASLGGYLPSITIGLFSPFVNSIATDPSAISYGMLNVLIAVFYVWAEDHGWFKSFFKTICAILIFAVIGGVLGSFLTWFLYGFAQEDTSAGLVGYIYQNWHTSPFVAQLLADYIIDVADKAINVIVVFIVLKLLPDSFKKMFHIHTWRQAPLTSEAMKEMGKKHSRKMSLKFKITLMLSLASGLVAVSAITISYIIYRDSIMTTYLAGDITLEQLHAAMYAFLARQISLFFGVFVLILAAGLYFAQYEILLPLNTMSMAASMYSDAEGSMDDSVKDVGETTLSAMEEGEQQLREITELFENIGIITGDEIENLYLSFSRMTDENLAYVRDIMEKTRTINEMQVALIMVLADMVESRDQNTGDHIRKTAEYVKLIMEEMRREGIYADELTDRFVADVESAAPLHDIGKISVSDVILNKPGKLTDEEFEIMKTHTTMGAKIIDQVIDTVPDADSYLMEARRLALYHHEKWNGQGYPQGLSGEEIPLSARIMAVADVFDALVSKRAYKDGFPFEKAMDIIRESSGSHFDPQVAQAFINAETKVREVAERNSTFSSKG